VRAWLSHPILDLLPPEPVSATSIKLRWKLQKDARRYVHGFYIRYRDLTSGTRHFRMEMVTKSNPQEYTVKELAKDTQYEFFMIPYHSQIHGHPSNSRIEKTLEDVPSSPPSGLQSSVVNVSTTVLTWLPPLPGRSNGVLTSYTLWVFVNNTHQQANVTVSAS
ncbi:unnamed protein product, partial [Meganyctiphanes norvegica]